jgi:hypothetical protein
MSLLPKRTVKDPSTPEERRITNRNVANIYKGLEYGSYALGVTGAAKVAFTAGKSLFNYGKTHLAKSIVTKQHPAVLNQSIKNSMGVPPRKYTLYSGSVKGDPFPTSLKGAKYDKWWTNKQAYAIRHTMPYGVVSKTKLNKLPKVEDDLKAYSKAWVGMANKGGGELRKVTLNQKEMLAASKVNTNVELGKRGWKPTMFSKGASESGFSQSFHGPLPISLLNKSVKIPLKPLTNMKIKPTHYDMSGGVRRVKDY